MPVWARHLTGTYLPAAVQRAHLQPVTRLPNRLVGLAYPELPCRALATARATAAADAAA